MYSLEGILEIILYCFSLMRKLFLTVSLTDDYPDEVSLGVV